MIYFDIFNNNLYKLVFIIIVSSKNIKNLRINSIQNLKCNYLLVKKKLLILEDEIFFIIKILTEFYLIKKF